MIMEMSVLAGLFFVLWQIGRWIENKDWNQGVCPKCGNKWIYFDTDSQGGRGFTCRGDCNNTTWQSYNKRKEA